MNHSITILTMTALALTGLAGCTGGGADIVQAGSSTLLPAATLWADGFNDETGAVVSVAGGGSGAGASGLCSGKVDVGDMSRPMKDSEKQTCRANGIEPVEWKTAFDGLSVVVDNANDFVQDLSVEQLEHIFRSQDPARQWSDVDPSFPGQEIVVCMPDNESGTYDYFTEVILDEGEPRSDAQQSADDNVLVQCINGDRNAIGFFGYAYVINNEDKVRAIQVNGVAPTSQTIEDGSYAPLGRPLFIYTAGIPENGTLLHDYITYILDPQRGQKDVEQVGYVKLSPAVLQEMQDQLAGN